MDLVWISIAYKELIQEAEDLGLSPRPSALGKSSIFSARVTI